MDIEECLTDGFSGDALLALESGETPRADSPAPSGVASSGSPASSRSRPSPPPRATSLARSSSRTSSVPVNSASYIAGGMYALLCFRNLGLAPVATMRIAEPSGAAIPRDAACSIGVFLRLSLALAAVAIGVGVLTWWWSRRRGSRECSTRIAADHGRGAADPGIALRVPRNICIAASRRTACSRSLGSSWAGVRPPGIRRRRRRPRPGRGGSDPGAGGGERGRRGPEHGRLSSGAPREGSIPPPLLPCSSGVSHGRPQGGRKGARAQQDSIISRPSRRCCSGRSEPDVGGVPADRSALCPACILVQGINCTALPAVSARAREGRGWLRRTYWKQSASLGGMVSRGWSSCSHCPVRHPRRLPGDAADARGHPRVGAGALRNAGSCGPAPFGGPRKAPDRSEHRVLWSVHMGQRGTWLAGGSPRRRPEPRFGRAEGRVRDSTRPVHERGMWRPALGAAATPWARRRLGA